jgi:hypothetical protein
MKNLNTTSRQSILITIAIFISLTFYGQSNKLLTSGGQLINFSSSTGFQIENLPMSPNCGYSTPVYDEQILDTAIVFREFGEDDADINYDEVLYYLGQPPVFCQAIQTDDKGNILFFIVDNNIYNRFGESFTNITQKTIYPQAHYWLHQLHNSDNLDGEFINRSYMVNTVPLSANLFKMLGQEVAIVPVPGAINEFYIIYNIDNEYYTLDTNRDHFTFYRKLTYYSDKLITMTHPEIIESDH